MFAAADTHTRDFLLEMDVSRLKNYDIDVENQRATFQPGLKLIEVTWILSQQGFMLPAGFNSSFIMMICKACLLLWQRFPHVI